MLTVAIIELLLELMSAPEYSLMFLMQFLNLSLISRKSDFELCFPDKLKVEPIYTAFSDGIERMYSR